MKLQKLNEWLLLLTNVAVVAGIVFLAVEIQQNNKLLASGSRQAMLQNDQAGLLVALDNVDSLIQMDGSGPLSQSDQIRISAIYLIDLRNREFEFFQYKNGLLDEASWVSYREIIKINHTTPMGRMWWEKVGRLTVDAEFVKMVDDMLADAPPNEVVNLIGNWFESLE